MKLFYSTTSPYARLVRIALREKGLSGFEERLTDPPGRTLQISSRPIRVPVCPRSY
jgi:glutathione S-transferase